MSQIKALTLASTLSDNHIRILKTAIESGETARQAIEKLPPKVKAAILSIIGTASLGRAIQILVREN
jgi:hypothetical protein